MRWKECFFKGTALSLSVFAANSMIMLLSSTLSPYLSLSLSHCLCVWVCVLPPGKIRHESWKQALQSYSTLQIDERNNCLFYGDREVEVDLVSIWNINTTHNLWLSPTFPVFILCVYTIHWVSSYLLLFSISPLALLPPFLAVLTGVR